MKCERSPVELNYLCLRAINTAELLQKPLKNSTPRCFYDNGPIATIF